ncbi:Mu transposase C-terminal domain-containing protein [Brevundimonas diminuta]|uniref:Mu transposase C-terminal domain-containing protein n=1 Tax=Brevundimonas diminuta TaxID=293 RepID=UPI00289CE2D1|nr:DDE-type integrase/transposase/recombinase [Brevundimonas diminuta]
MTETHHAPARDNKLERIASCSDAQWLELEARAKMLRSVAELPPRSRRRSIATQEAALLLGASLATTYRWLSRYDGQVEDLLPAPPGQPPGRLRLAAPVQAVIDHGIRKHHLSKQKIPLSETVRRIQSDCIRLGLRPPSRKAIQTRLDSFDQREVARCRGELLRAEKLSVRSGSYDVRSPMAVWQIDHTTMDVMVVSSIEGVAIGRPYLTLIVDVATRMIAGFYISLDPPSSRNVAAALLQGVSPKDEVLKSLGIAGNWPIQGLPDALHTDNASEFAKAAGYRRGCANYHVELVLRDVGKPRDGGHIERLIGTMMGRVHFLPGSTFSNPKQKEKYKSEVKARLTIDELQQWFAQEVLDYHERRHSMLGISPREAWETMCREQQIAPRMPRNMEQFYIGFLPSKIARIQRQGIQFKTLEYSGPVLSELRRYGTNSVEFRFDPNDLSSLFIQSRTGIWVPINIRHKDRPSLTLWEVDAEVRRRKALSLGPARGNAIPNEILKRREQRVSVQAASRREARDGERLRQGGHLIVADNNSLRTWSQIMVS